MRSDIAGTSRISLTPQSTLDNAVHIRSLLRTVILLVDAVRPPRLEATDSSRSEIVRRCRNTQLDLQGPNQSVDRAPAGISVLYD